MQVEDFISNFTIYCQQRFPNKTGTATSYKNAIKYLLNFMNSTEVTGETILEIKSLEPDIRDSSSILYGELEEFFSSTDRYSYLSKGFLKAALPVLFQFSDNFGLQSDDNVILLQELKDDQVIANFTADKLRNELPISENYFHNYNVRRISGTVNEVINKTRSGRQAEKYLISFLLSLGFIKNRDFFDVANNKAYGYDVRFFNVGLEIKNINSGSFYLSDNEIARLDKTDTHLILVDINNGIWLLHNKSLWLKNVISNIKDLREYSKINFKNLDPSDIKILIDKELECDVVNIVNFSKEELVDKLNNIML